jgi:two-component system LytT family response regulator
MKIAVFDEEKDVLNETRDLLAKNVRSDDTVAGFTSIKDAVDYVKEYITDTAFICFHDDQADGLKLVEELRKINPKINIIFISDSNLYMHEAFEMRVSGFLRRPVTGEDIRREMQNLRFHIEEFRKSLR